MAKSSLRSSSKPVDHNVIVETLTKNIYYTAWILNKIVDKLGCPFNNYTPVWLFAVVFCVAFPLQSQEMELESVMQLVIDKFSHGFPASQLSDAL